ncbi:C39 family peptidase [Akkermansiaceae bacterium]|nr:C39 family peptidase [Akkermansiaceae bacterium]
MFSSFPRSFTFTRAAVVASLTLSVANAQKMQAKLDGFFDLDKLPTLTTADVEAMVETQKFKKNHPYFTWMDEDKQRAIIKKNKFGNVKVGLSIFEGEIPIEEAVIDFEEGKFEGVTFSIFNRGDGGSISQEEFQQRFDKLSEFFTTELKKQPSRREGNIKKGVMTSGHLWRTQRGNAVLVHNVDADKKVEFLRLKLFPATTKEGTYKAALEDRSYATVRKSKLSSNVEKKDGNVYIANLPMVDQGGKGYCVVASAQRLFEYYGIDCDMHQLAQLAKSDPNLGTSTLLINRELGAIDYLFQTRFSCLAVAHEGKLVELKDDKYVGKEINEKKAMKIVQSNIDKGIPLLWSLELGQAKEEPNLNPQTSGGHMRMIIGYNDKEEKIIFSDSWGKGHAFKTMSYDDFYRVTKGLFLMVPTSN